MRIRPPVKYHGGKFYLSGWIIENLPKNIGVYVEPFCGGASVLLNKPKSDVEFLNDIDSDLISLWVVIQKRCNEFITNIHNWPYSEHSFQKAKNMVVPPNFSCNPDVLMDKAIKQYVLCRMSRGGMKRAFAWSKRLRGGKPGDENAWDTMIAHLPLISNRIQSVNITNLPALSILQSHISDSFIYLDPPYVKNTRCSTDVYNYEMSDHQHEELLDMCVGSKSKVIISGYQCPLYMDKLKNWNFKSKSIVNHSSQATKKPIKTECLWMNY
jgi:DNA adenine methylase